MPNLLLLTKIQKFRRWIGRKMPQILNLGWASGTPVAWWFNQDIEAKRWNRSLPGATKIFDMCLDWASFQEMACSRPPLPNSKTFIVAAEKPSKEPRARWFGPCLPSSMFDIYWIYTGLKLSQHWVKTSFWISKLQVRRYLGFYKELWRTNRFCQDRIVRGACRNWHEKMVAIEIGNQRVDISSYKFLMGLRRAWTGGFDAQSSTNVSGQSYCHREG